MPLVKIIPGHKAVYRGDVLIWKSTRLQITARVLYILAGSITVLWKNSADAVIFNEMASKGKKFVLTQNGVSKVMSEHYRQRNGRMFHTTGYGDESVFFEDEDVLITLEGE